ncbi:MFS general substrate transporter [Dacryopinax primogenitus]|uniref:MFS general substrate transporter n=1 Tax=Dacryopinax primogenitus (strain DJM 731) TaxID=1858805 RepID=M5GD53_DACPD|nr:MFS general substrate transporter [Dacryopinax primogenitus]EJU06610.1 MFS general substrate transporter [Dacryopinax primogenitus]
MTGKNPFPTSLEPSDVKEATLTVEHAIAPEEHEKIFGTRYDFGGEGTLPPPPKLSPEEELRLYRKIDRRLMPILSLMYLLSFLDRGNIGNAKIAGLTTDLGLVGNKYNIALTMFFVVSNLVLKKFRPSRWLPGIAIVWGIVMTCMGLVSTYGQLVAVRVCLGVAEAGLFPGVVYYLTLWYPRYMVQYRIGLFFGAATIAGAFSGLLAYGIEHMAGVGGKDGWSWIFILEGLATILVGILAFFVLVDFPVTAKFLTPEERAYAVWKKSVTEFDNSSVGEEEHFELRYLVQCFTDWQVYIHILVYMSVITPLYGISLFLPSIINNFGYSTAVSQLLTVPCYVFATIVLLLFAHFSDRHGIRSPFILAGLCMLAIGFGINISSAPSGAKYFGTFLCVAGSYAPFPGVIAWLGNNLSGQYKRGAGMALHIGIGNFAGAIASNIFRTQDAPRYILGHALELMFVGIGFISVPTVVLIYMHIDKKRDEMMREIDAAGGIHARYSEEEIRSMGDKSPDFRYTL